MEKHINFLLTYSITRGHMEIRIKSTSFFTTLSYSVFLSNIVLFYFILAYKCSAFPCRQIRKMIVSSAGALCYSMIFVGFIHMSYCSTESLVPPPQCDPNSIEEAPYQLQKVCAALSTIYRLSNAMESYLEESAPRQIQCEFMQYVYLYPKKRVAEALTCVLRADLEADVIFDSVFSFFFHRRKKWE